MAKRTSLHGMFYSSTAKVAQLLGISQQSASRKLREMRQKGLIELQSSPSGIKARLLDKGIKVLKQDYLELKQLFASPKSRQLSGRAKTGLGEGSYYVSQKGYEKQFVKSLGFRPFPGTLNLVVDEALAQSFIAGIPEIEIRGFRTEKRSFGSIRAFKVLIEGKEHGAIIVPERSSHPSNEIEVIAPSWLRKKFRLKEEGKIKLTA